MKADAGLPSLEDEEFVALFRLITNLHVVTLTFDKLRNRAQGTGGEQAGPPLRYDSPFDGMASDASQDATIPKPAADGIAVDCAPDELPPRSGDYALE
jgi:hypothetical protein